MALDTRDYWKKWHNKRAGYKERAGFRLSDGEFKQRKYRNAWRTNFIRVAGLIVVLICVLLLREYLR